MFRLIMRRIAFSLVGVLVLSLAGCPASSSGENGGDEQAVKDLVGDISDLAGDPEKFKTKFMGEVPTDREKYYQLMYYATEVTLDGNNATMIVRVKTNDSKEQKLGEVQWKAVKDGDAWKLTEAPLPAVP